MLLSTSNYTPILASSDVKQTAQAVTVKIVSEDNHGSGVIVSKQGDEYTVLTNAHVLCGKAAFRLKQCGAKPNYYKVITPDNREYQVPSTTVLKIGNELDIAIVKFRSPLNYSVAKFANSSQVGYQAQVFSAGFPAGKKELKFDSGRVVANVSDRLSGDGGGYTMLYDVDTLPGMSGSGIFNSEGQIVAIHGQGDRFKPGTEPGEAGNWRIGHKIGVNRGIPINRLKLVNNQVTAINSNVSEPSTAEALFIASFNKFVTPESQQIESDKRIALGMINKTIGKQPNYLHAYLRRGVTRFQTGDRSGAIQDLNKAISLDSKNPNFYINRGQFKYSIGKKKEALDDFKQALRLGSRDVKIYLGIALIEEEEGNIEEAINFYREAASIYSKQGNIVSLGVVNYNIENLRKKKSLGIRSSRQSIAKKPKLDREIRTDYDIAYSVDGISIPETSFSGQSFDLAMRSNSEAEEKLRGSSSMAAFSPSGQILATGNSEGDLSVWQFQSNGQFSKAFDQNLERSIKAIAVSPDDRLLAIGIGSSISIRRLSDGKNLYYLDDHRGTVTSLAISLDGQTLVSASLDKTVKVWQLSDGKLLRSLQGHQFIVGSVVISPDGKNIVSGSSDGTIKLWQLQDGQLIRSITVGENPNRVNSVAISPDGKTIISAGDSINQWSLETGKLLNTTKSEFIHSVAIAPNGQTFITGDMENKVRMWRMSDGKMLRTLDGHRSWVLSVAISPDGRTLVSSSRDRNTRIWQVNPRKK